MIAKVHLVVKVKSRKLFFHDSLSYAIADSMTGVDVDNIKNLTAYCIARRLDNASVSYWRRLTVLSSMYTVLIIS